MRFFLLWAALYRIAVLIYLYEFILGYLADGAVVGRFIVFVNVLANYAFPTLHGIPAHLESSYCLKAACF
jgi:hypothetical protein